MLLIGEIEEDELRNSKYILTDKDETLMFNSKLSPEIYLSLERLQKVIVNVIPVMAAPVG